MFEVGQTILGVYIIERFLGAGGSGQVFLVRRTIDDALYAMKTILPEKMDSPRLRQDLLREIRVSQRIGNHPNIVSSRFFRTVQGSMVVFSDYVAGGTVRQWMRGGKLKLREELLDIAIQMAWGLDMAHDAGIIHKDIKPANILMTADGVARVADFGLLRGMTPAFCSPEQMNNDVITTATDIWSWALTVMVMWLGKTPWMLGPQAIQALPDLQSKAGLFGAAPGELIDLLLDCLQENPGSRATSFLPIVEKLKRIYEIESGHGYPRPDPPEISATTDSRTDGKDRQSVIDGLKWDDPRGLLKKIIAQLHASHLDLSTLVPEISDPEVTFIDDINVYMHLEIILKRLSSEGDPMWMDMLKNVLTHKGWLFMDSGDQSGAIECLKEVCEIIRELILYHNRLELWQILGGRLSDIGLCYLDSRQHEQALVVCEKSLKAFQHTPEANRIPQYYIELQNQYCHLGIICNLLDQKERATEAYSKCLEIIENYADKDPVKYDRDKPIALFNLGTNLLERELFDKSLVVLRGAEQMLEVDRTDTPSLTRLVFKGKVTGALAMVYQLLAQYEHGVQYFEKADRILSNALESSNHPYIQTRYGVNLKNWALCLLAADEMDSALEMMTRSLTLFKRLMNDQGTTENTHYIAEIYTDLEALYLKTGDKKSAENARLQSEKYQNHSQEITN